MQFNHFSLGLVVVFTSAGAFASGQQQTPEIAKTDSVVGLDPFESAAFSPTASRDVRLLSGKPDCEFAVAFSESAQEIKRSLGNLRAGSSHLIEFKLENKLGFDIKFDRITSSCGCISGLPKDVVLKPNVSIPVRVVLRIPSNEEKFEKVINLVDSRNTINARVIIDGQSIPTIRLGVDWFAIPKSGRKTFETKVECPLDKIEELKFRFNSPEIAGWRVIPESERTGTLVFDVVPEENNAYSDFVRLQVLAKDNAALADIPIKFFRGAQPAIRPSKIIVKQIGGALVGRVMVQLKGLLRLV